MGLFDGKVAIVTGAGRGIGRSHALLLASEGAAVVVNDLGGSSGGDGADATPAQQVVDEITAAGGKAVANYDSVSSWDGAQRMVQQAVDELGGLDVLINNASDLGPTPLAMLSDTECEDLERAFTTNVIGPFRLTKALMGALAASAREGRGAVVLNISSDAAINAYPGWGAYGSSKAALHHLTRIWNEEHVNEGVHFLSLDPGDMDTPMHAAAIPDADPATLKRPEQAAHELAEAIAALLKTWNRTSQEEGLAPAFS